MDTVIAQFETVRDRDLRVAANHGVAYQLDMAAGRVEYDAAYLAKYDAYERTPIGESINAGRRAFVERHAAPGASVLDVGAASGTFVRELAARGFEAYGFDVIPEAMQRLRDQQRFAFDPRAFDVVSFWDCLEHLEDPGRWLRRVSSGALVFASIPVFGDLSTVRASKHYRPGEHLYYWTRDGFVAWMSVYGFRLLEESAHEVESGRESIGAFAFRRSGSQ